MLRWSIMGATLVPVAGTFFALGRWLQGSDTDVEPILEIQTGQGYTILTSPGPAEGTAIYGPTASVVPFPSNSDMNVLDPTGRYLFTSHETRSASAVTRIDLEADEVVIEYVLRPAFGQRRHEGLAIDWRGFLYGVDEDPKGSIYRFRPHTPLALIP